MSRADRVAARLAERELDLLLVTDLVNVRYLTGFTGTNGLALVGPETRRFVTDSRYVERARGETNGFDIEPAERELRAVLAGGWPDGPVRLGFEDQHVSVRSHAQLRETLPDRVELVADLLHLLLGQVGVLLDVRDGHGASSRCVGRAGVGLRGGGAWGCCVVVQVLGGSRLRCRWCSRRRRR